MGATRCLAHERPLTPHLLGDPLNRTDTDADLTRNFLMPSLPPRSLVIARSLLPSILFRPSFTPCAFALASPALIRSRIMDRSNSANTTAHLKQGPAGRRRCIDALLLGKYRSTLAAVRLSARKPDEVLQGPAQAIDGPSHDHVEPAPGGVWSCRAYQTPAGALRPFRS